jgi:hypothetical protein
MVFPLAVNIRMGLVKHAKLIEYCWSNVDLFLEFPCECLIRLLARQTMATNDVPNTRIETAVRSSFTQQYATTLD